MIYHRLSCSLVGFWTPMPGGSICFTGITTLCPETPGWVVNVGLNPVLCFCSHGMVDRASVPIKYRSVSCGGAGGVTALPGKVKYSSGLCWHCGHVEVSYLKHPNPEFPSSWFDWWVFFFCLPRSIFHTCPQRRDGGECFGSWYGPYSSTELLLLTRATSSTTCDHSGAGKGYHFLMGGSVNYLKRQWFFFLLNCS